MTEKNVGSTEKEQTEKQARHEKKHHMKQHRARNAGGGQPGIKQTDAVQPGMGPAGAVQAGIEPVDAGQQSMEPAGAVQAGKNPVEAMQPGKNPVETVQPGIKPAGAVQAGKNPVETVQPGIKPAGAVQPGIKPVEAVQPGMKQADAVQADAAQKPETQEAGQQNTAPQEVSASSGKAGMAEGQKDQKDQKDPAPGGKARSADEPEKKQKMPKKRKKPAAVQGSGRMAKVEEERISIRRIVVFFFMVLIFLGGSAYMFFSEGSHSRMDLAVAGFLNGVGLLIWISVLLHIRNGSRVYFQDTNYRLLLVVMAFSWIIVLLGRALPVFLYPVMLVGFLLSTTLEGAFAMAVDVYFVLELCSAVDVTNREPFCLILLSCIAVLLGEYLKNSGSVGRLPTAMAVMFLQITVPQVFYFLTYGKLPDDIRIGSVVLAIVTALFVILIHHRIYRRFMEERRVTYSEILDDEYPLLVEFERFSMQEFDHAMRVSAVCRKLAQLIGVDDQLAAAGGMYYRIGKLLGEPIIDHAVMLATSYGFPKDLIAILYEYEGVLRKPQTRESAIVHLVDSLVKRLDLIEKSDDMQKEFDQHMLIYQMTNELSSQGYYDESGLSMNQFLKIRDQLVREGELLDDHIHGKRGNARFGFGHGL